jgi:periplasmic protein CpxP/Spy
MRGFKIIGLAILWIGSVWAQSVPSQSQSMENTLDAGLPAQWWRRPLLAERLGLSADQQKKMDDVFFESRLKLIDLNASLEKEEMRLEPLVAMDRPDEAKIRTQIDRIAQARAELEKANSYLLLGIRLILSPEQWKGLQAGSGGPRARRLRDQSETSPASSTTPHPKKFN